MREFVGGQCRVQTKERELSQGEIKAFRIYGDNPRRIRIYFAWLCSERRAFDKLSKPWKTKLKWLPTQCSLGPPFLDLSFRTYYYQPDEERIKMWGGGGSEVYRFYKPDDHLRLVPDGGNYIPYHELYAHKLKLALWVALVSSK